MREEDNLKTLKNIIYNIDGDCRDTDLRAEAIKWVKDNNWCEVGDPYCCPYSVKGWIKHFFNLTEKELAGGEE